MGTPPLSLLKSVAIGSAIMAGLCRGACADSYSAEVLFTVEYGESDAEAGVWVPTERGEAGGGPPCGPTGIAVGADGSIFIADRVNDCVKRFDRAGQLLMRTEGASDNIQHVAVDSEGNCYALHGAGMDLLSKFGVEGKKLWQTELFAAIPPEILIGRYSGFSRIMAGPDDSVFVQMTGGEVGLAAFDGSGEFLRAYDAYACTPGGHIVSRAAVPGRRLAVEVRVSDLQDQHLGSYIADLSSGDTSMLEGVEGGLSGGWFDSAGHVHNVVMARRQSRIPLSPQLGVASDTILVRHDLSGRPVAYLRFPSFPFKTGGHLTVDGLGDVYDLSYGPTSVDVVRYRLDTSVREVRSLWAFPTLRRDGEVYAPLVEVARRAGMEVQWNPRTKQAAVLSAASPARTLAKIGPHDRGAIFHLGRVWISPSIAQAMLGLALTTDRTRRVAYLERASRPQVASVRRMAPAVSK